MKFPYPKLQTACFPYILAGSLCRFLPGPLKDLLLWRIERAIPDLITVFDADYYRRTTLKAALSDMDALRHYILRGSREARDPSPLFDTQYYLEQIDIPEFFPFSPLAHFLLVGRFQRISPTPWFDYAFYEHHHPELMTRRICPYLHFLQYGLKYNWQGSAQFDPAAYLKAHPELPEDRPALLHFLQSKEKHHSPSVTEGPPPRWLTAPADSSVDPSASDIVQCLHELAHFRQTPANSQDDPSAVHIILPVYEGFDPTLRALYRILTSRNKTPWTLTVINDCSPNDQLSRTLRTLADKLPFRLVEHEKNEGFVRTANEGMRMHPRQDVVLLNADTEVYNDWLDRLRAAAYSLDTVATVTPLSNNATICSYPQFLKNNVAPLELPWSALDALAARVNAGMRVQAPTGVGFCMYITRRALDAVGLFDEETFDRGYGEENDFCQRAEKSGFINLLAADVFVRHVGSVSFGKERRRLIDEALKKVNRRHPGYRERVQAFIRDDPLHKARVNLDRARLKRLRRERNVLFLGLTRGGGAELAMHRHMLREKDAGKSVFVFVPTGEGSRVRIKHIDADHFPNMPVLDLDAQKHEAVRLLQDLDIGLIEIHHLIDLSMRAPNSLLEICAEANIPFHFHVHDYLSICPRINLIGKNGLYCDEQGLAQCRRCLKGYTFKGRSVNIVEWRRAYGHLLRQAAQVVVPCHDAAERMQRYFPETKIELRPHEAPVEGVLQLPKREDRSFLHIAVLGAIGAPKGFHVLLALARHVRKKRLPVKLSVIGYTRHDAKLRSLGVHITGPYSDDHVQDLIAVTDPDCLFIPSIWPETYSFTLSQALRSGRPLVAFDIGVFPERLRDLPHALLLPLDMHDKPADILERLVPWLHGLKHRHSGRIVHFREPSPLSTVQHTTQEGQEFCF